MKKNLIKSMLSVLMMVMIVSLTACGGGSKNYVDGTYEGQSQVYEGEDDGSAAGYGVATITIRDNVITACEYYTYEPD